MYAQTHNLRQTFTLALQRHVCSQNTSTRLQLWAGHKHTPAPVGWLAVYAGAGQRPSKRSAGAGAGGAACHKVDPTWNLSDHLAALRAANDDSRGGTAARANGKEGGDRGGRVLAKTQLEGGASWREIFWDVWGVVSTQEAAGCVLKRDEAIL